MGSRHFRAGVVIVVRRDDGHVLAFERVDQPGQWQLPQGGIQPGETPDQAAWRELTEETGLGPNDVELIGEHPAWVAYEWPREVVAGDNRLGQVQRWFFFRPRHDTIEPAPDGHEFRAWRWAQSAWLIDQVVPFRRPAYETVLG